MKKETVERYYRQIDQQPTGLRQTAVLRGLEEFLALHCSPKKMVEPGAEVCVLFSWPKGDCLQRLVFPSLRLLSTVLRPTLPPGFTSFPSFPGLPSILTPNSPFFEMIARTRERDKFRFTNKEGVIIKAEIQKVE